ncbi:MAG: MBL fold metallo-hydrolase, partial [Candidatus Jordarchaeaceae archaeon]
EISNRREPSIIIAASGMCNGGRIKYHLERHISDPYSTLLFAGYQAKGTLGRELVEGRKTVKIYGKSYPVRIRVESLQGLSAHADKMDILNWFRKIKSEGLREVFLVHGDYEESLALAKEISPKNQVRIPQQGETVKIS